MTIEKVDAVQSGLRGVKMKSGSESYWNLSVEFNKIIVLIRRALRMDTSGKQLLYLILSNLGFLFILYVVIYYYSNSFTHSISI